MLLLYDFYFVCTYAERLKPFQHVLKRIEAVALVELANCARISDACPVIMTAAAPN
jgi:hypothetical protein